MTALITLCLIVDAGASGAAHFRHPGFGKTAGIERGLFGGKFMTKRMLAVAVAGLVGIALFAATKAVKVELKNAQGQSVGTATVSAAGSGVKIKLDLKNLPPGE